jgi:hypothetical protein
VAGCGSSGAPLLAPLRALLSRPVVGISRYDLVLLLNWSAIGLWRVHASHRQIGASASSTAHTNIQTCSKKASVPQLAVESVLGDLEPLPVLALVVLQDQHVVGLLCGCSIATRKRPHQAAQQMTIVKAVLMKKNEESPWYL